MVEHVIPVLGHIPLENVTRSHIRELVAGIRETHSKRTGRPFSPRTVLHIYRTLVTAFSDAVLDGYVTATPCTLRVRRGERPAKKDADLRWRGEAVYTREEAETLLSAPAVPLERRVLYGLMLLAGLRGAAATGRRWRDFDSRTRPLGRLTIATQADGNKGERGTRTGAIREAPMVPALSELLHHWFHNGDEARFLTPPRPDASIVPGPRCQPSDLRFRGGTTVYVNLQRDLESLGLRRVPALRHSMHATFLTLVEADGANMAIARRCTHSAAGDVVAGYVRTSWDDVCREVARLRVGLREGWDVGATPGAIHPKRNHFSQSFQELENSGCWTRSTARIEHRWEFWGSRERRGFRRGWRWARDSRGCSKRGASGDTCNRCTDRCGTTGRGVAPGVGARGGSRRGG